MSDNSYKQVKTRKKVFVLVDCNNFFVSCERAFDPSLTAVPVGVLSNNDGCFVARSNEVKQLGIPMGAPYFKYQELVKKHDIKVFSANFKLYGDMSQRVTAVLSEAAPRIEIYSVDESFLEIGDLAIDDYQGWAQNLAQKIQKHTGIPVSVGVAPTKTLAKVASERAKKFSALRGGCSLVPDSKHPQEAIDKKRETYLKWLDLSDVWGIGRRYSSKLKSLGLSTAWDFASLSEAWVLDNMTITGLRTHQELNNQSCIALEEHNDKPQQSIMSSRSFGHNIRSLHQLEEAVATFSAKAAARLRRKRELAWCVTTFIKTGHNAPEQRSVGFKAGLLEPSNDTAKIIKAALNNLYYLYDGDFAYKKAGVMLTELVPESAQQLALGQEHDRGDHDKRQRLLQAVDKLNYHSNTVFFASQGAGKNNAWHSKSSRRSQFYTGSWQELPTVKVI